MATFEALPETEVGRALFDELLWVHSMIRRDLGIVERLAADAASNLPAEKLKDKIKDLKTNGRLWQLKVGCLRYCRFVHSHHNAEDALLFPALRQADPAVDPIVSRLEADHRKVSVLLDAVEDFASALTSVDDGKIRARLVDALKELATHLLEHLDFEELNAGPTLRRLKEF
jgi:Hemerythrin HHE cation binding domain